MQLLTEVFDVNELTRLRTLFEANGIAVYVSNEDTARNMSVLHPAGKYGIFVVYENQFADAQALMEDENHVVENPMDLREYKLELASQAPNARATIIKVLLYVVVLLFAVIGTLIYFLS